MHCWLLTASNSLGHQPGSCVDNELREHPTINTSCLTLSIKLLSLFSTELAWLKRSSYFNLKNHAQYFCLLLVLSLSPCLSPSLPLSLFSSPHACTRTYTHISTQFLEETPVFPLIAHRGSSPVIPALPAQSNFGAGVLSMLFHMD